MSASHYTQLLDTQCCHEVFAYSNAGLLQAVQCEESTPAG